MTPDEFLDLSDERDVWLRRVLQAEKDGYTRGQAEGYEKGYTAAMSDLKKLQHGTVLDLRQHLTTWDGLRTRFADPRPGDYPGTQTRNQTPQNHAA